MAGTLADGGRARATLPSDPSAPVENICCRNWAWLTRDPGAKLWVSHTFPPTVEPRPIVIRPRMVAPA